MEKGKFVLCTSSTRVPKIERKIAEKNRRDRTKILYSNLLCLLPNHGSKKAMPLLDQIDEAITYIESLKIKVEEMKKKNKYLLQRKRSHSCITSEIQANNTEFSPPLVEIHDMGPTMDVIFVIGLDDLSKFRNILHLLHEESIEVVNANFSMHGHSTFQILYNEIGKSRLEFGATTMSKRLNDLICGSMCRQVESNFDIWDYEIQSDICWFDNPEVIDAYMSLAYCQGFENSHADGGC
ncbi:transcription factor bHLH162-like [Olea europaea subsp. europaea]|uniref:Transcription factor bHLH162-like n=1 Tax=Olea europaea subsp. europaea TaxID=158383 RepID=A0A8S0TV14_OLEEU|nr:transcription factor bHLH162-like [Olea europaea subsp. europaea]